MSEQQEPTPAVHLEQAMVENTRQDNHDTRVKVYQELLFSDLLLALSDTPPTEAEDTQDNPAMAAVEAAPSNNQLNIAILANPQGLKFAAVFTSPQAVRRWRPDGGQYATMRGQDIFKILSPDAPNQCPAEVIVVNPGSAPLIALQKAEFRQLALGIIPKTNRSPVQVPDLNQVTNNAQVAAPAEGQSTPPNAIQITFPTNVFNDNQKEHAHSVLHNHDKIVSAAIGAILPPNAPNKDSWIRTIFLRVQDLENNQDTLKNFCHDVRTQITENAELFADNQFEVGVMPDPKFWESLHQNNLVLFDKSNIIPFGKQQSTQTPNAPNS